MIPSAEALQALVDAGQFEAASALALKIAKRESLTTAPEEPAQRDWLTSDELKSLDIDGVRRLRTEHPEVYQKSLAMIGQKPAPEVGS